MYNRRFDWMKITFRSKGSGLGDTHVLSLIVHVYEYSLIYDEIDGI